MSKDAASTQHTETPSNSGVRERLITLPSTGSVATQDADAQNARSAAIINRNHAFELKLHFLMKVKEEDFICK